MTAGEGGAAPRIALVIFDFNGTIVDDQALLADVYAEVLREEGIAFDKASYPPLAGLPDDEIFNRLTAFTDHTLHEFDIERLSADRVRRYLSKVSPSLVQQGVRDFIDAASGYVPLAIASGAFTSEIRHTLERLQLGHLFHVVVGIDQVTAGKPSPDGFLLALQLVNSSRADDPPIEAHEVLVIEDSTPGVVAAQAAGMRTLALRGAAYERDVARADHETDALHGALARSLLA